MASHSAGALYKREELAHDICRLKEGLRNTVYYSDNLQKLFRLVETIDKLRATNRRKNDMIRILLARAEELEKAQGIRQ